MKQGKISTAAAGIDVGKRRLDVAVHGQELSVAFDNGELGIAKLVAWLSEQGVRRVGMEATGGYERKVRSALDAAGFEVIVHQPLEVRLFARLKRLKAKNDRLDAHLIAAATAYAETVKDACDPRLRELAERLTAYEQVSDQIAQLKAFMEHVRLDDLTTALRRQIGLLKATKAAFARTILAKLRAQPDLAQRHDLLRSIPGFGPIVAACLVIRMPELGRMRREQAAALLGVAPFDRDSGQFRGQRFIAGGRARPRRMVYLAALAAKRADPFFKAIAQRLQAKGKPPKVVAVAVMRRLIHAANLVLARGQPWTPAAQT